MFQKAFVFCKTRMRLHCMDMASKFIATHPALAMSKLISARAPSTQETQFLFETAVIGGIFEYLPAYLGRSTINSSQWINPKDIKNVFIKCMAPENKFNILSGAQLGRLIRDWEPAQIANLVLESGMRLKTAKDLILVMSLGKSLDTIKIIREKNNSLGEELFIARAPRLFMIDCFLGQGAKINKGKK